jgi:hypothetical protein
MCPRIDLATEQPVGTAPAGQHTVNAQLSPRFETFPSGPDRGRKDFKERRVVEKECASRSFPGDSQQMTITGSPDRRVG